MEVVSRTAAILICICLGLAVAQNRFNYDEVMAKVTKQAETLPLFLITDAGIEQVQASRRKRSTNVHDRARRAEELEDDLYLQALRKIYNQDLEEGPTMAEQAGKKAAKRAGRKTAVIEMIFVADSTIYKRFRDQNANQEKTLNALRLYYTLYAKLMDQWYGSFESDDVEVRVQPVGFIVSMTAETSPFTERIKGTNPATQAPDEVNASVGLRAFRDWLVKELQDFQVQYDHAMLFTDYSMYRGAGYPTSGLSFVGKICSLSKGWSASIMSEEGAFVGVYTSVHELTHNLGADHDGEIDKSCRAEENRVMAPTNYFGKDVAKNYFTFSKCTGRDLKKTFSGTRADCLLDTATSPPASRDDFQPPGQLMSVDQQCQDIIGPASSACEGTKYLKQRCYRLWCRNPDTKKCTTLGHTNAAFGTPCGDNKWCRLGECVTK